MKNIFIAGHNGMVGSAVSKLLRAREENCVLTETRKKLDLTNQKEVWDFISNNKIDEIYICAARVGGIMANKSLPASFIYDNLMIQNNIIHSAFEAGVKKLLFLGSSCIYPRNCEQPIKEEALMTGVLEPTNEAYSIAKIAGIKLCESYNKQFSKDLDIDYRCIMPTNLYGPGDNYDPKICHVIPALIGRFHEAKINGDKFVFVWGTGRPEREFLYVNDLASACVHVMDLDFSAYQRATAPELGHLNVGFGKDLTIGKLAELVSEIVGYKGQIKFDVSKPDGMPKKLLDSTRLMSTGWRPKIELREGLYHSYQDYLKYREKNGL